MERKIDLEDLGLTKDLKQLYDKEQSKGFLGRISVGYKGVYKVITENDDVLAKISGKLGYHKEYPAVGDWVVLDRDSNETGDALIQVILPRKSKFSRKAAGKQNEEQIVATNIDTIFICMSLNHDFNLRRLERYISLSWDSGAMPVVILTKEDLCEDIQSKVSEVQQVALGIDILPISVYENIGIEKIKPYIYKGQTIAFVGSSGVGKSTLINYLIGANKQKVSIIRKDDKGKHTTTYRELILLDEGGILIDTPGMREIQLYDADLDHSFKDIEELKKRCRFSDCQHETEPGCAVKQAIKDGKLKEERLTSYKKLQKELAYNKDRQILTSKQIEKKKIIQMVGSLDGIKKIKNRK